MKLNDPNGPLMSALGKLSDVVFCNIMFCIFSLPIVTIGASLTALYSCMFKLINEEEDDIIVKDFWRAFKANFKQSTLIWLLCLFVTLFLAAFYFLASNMVDILGRAYLIPFYLLVILFLFGFQYLFPMQARFKLKIRHTLKNSWLISVASLPWTLATVAVTGIAIFVTFFLDPNALNIAIFIWAFLGFGIVAYLNSFIFAKVFKRIEPEMEALSQEAPEGALFLDESHREDDGNMYMGSTFSDPDWNRQDYPLSDRKEVQGKGWRKRR